MQKPLLSVCIPTFNRAEYLAKSLASLVCQKEFPEIEVVISDNCSTDNTAEVVASYQKEYKNIFYYKNPINILDENFPTALMRGHGIFRKLFNDNSLYDDDVLKYILGLVQENKDQKKRPLLFFLNNGGNRNIKEIEVRGSGFSEFARLVSFRTTWIGGFGLWDNECENLEKEFPYCSTKLWQAWKCFSVVAEKKNFLVSNKRLLEIITVKNRDRSYGLYTVFYKNFLDLLAPYVDSGKLTCDDIAYIRKDMLYNNFAGFVFQVKRQKSDTNYGKEIDYRKKILSEYKHEKYYFSFWLYYLLDYKLSLPWRLHVAKLKTLGFVRGLFSKSSMGRKLLDLKRKHNIKLY